MSLPKMPWMATVTLSLVMVVLNMAVPSAAHAARMIIAVDTTVDSNDGAYRACTAAPNDCSLRGAISLVDADVANSYVLQLPASTLTLSLAGAGEDNNATGDLDIRRSVTVQGMSGVTTIHAEGLDRVVQVLSAARVTIDGVTLTGGNPGAADGGGLAIGASSVVTLTNSTVIGNTAQHGGGVYDLATLRVFTSTVSGNTATIAGGGIHNNGGSAVVQNSTVSDNHAAQGGGIRNDMLGYLAVSGSQIRGNQAGGGGGISNSGATVVVNNSTITDNHASSGNGGGVDNSSLSNTITRLSIVSSTIAGNTVSGSGGGVNSAGSQTTLTISSSTLSTNVAAASGGALFNYGVAGLNKVTLEQNTALAGGAVRNNSGNLALTNATLSGNSAGDNGGGILNDATALLTNVTLTENSAAGDGGAIFNSMAMTLKNTVVANSPAGANCFNDGTVITSSGHNLDSGTTCGLAAAGDLINIDPVLGPLQNNGGAPKTHALLAGSPAIDRGDDNGCPSTDERGAPRQGTCDIGAYEYQQSETWKCRVGTGSHCQFLPLVPVRTRMGPS